MARYEYGDRIGETAQVRMGSSAVIRDEQERILLTKRSDNGRWCLPGGAMEAGESVAECCVREVFEETGLRIRVLRLLGLYSYPHRVVVYADGNRWQVVAANFLAEIVEGTPGLSDEVTDIGFFTREEIANLDVIDPHRERIEWAFEDRESAFFE